jgi:diacylglycerol kinase family enzyme
MKTVVVYNAKSGSALPKSELEKLFSKHGINVETFIDITTGFPKNLRSFLNKNYIVAAIGGDGTLSSVANELNGSDAIFAPLPGGTLNHFTKDLGISQDLDVAVQNITKRTVKKIDIATVNGTVFLNNSSLGIYPLSLKFRENSNDAIGKWPAAIAGFSKALFHYKLYTVTIDGDEFKSPFIFIGNNDYHLTDVTSGGRQSINKGILSIYAVKTSSRIEVLKQLAYMLGGRSDMATKIEAWTDTSVTIHTKRTAVSISRDGELQKSTSPLEYKLVAGALNVIVE